MMTRFTEAYTTHVYTLTTEAFDTASHQWCREENRDELNGERPVTCEVKCGPDRTGHVPTSATTVSYRLGPMNLLGVFQPS